MKDEAFVTLRSPWAWVVPAAALVSMMIIWSIGANRELFHVINGLSRYTGEAFWANATVFGDSLVVFSLALWFAGRRPHLLWALLITALLGTLFVHGIKAWADLPRPATELFPDLVIIGDRLNWFSFPSGHSASALALAGLLCQSGDIAVRWKSAVLVVAILAAVSRVAVGAHWPLDILAGGGGGWLCAVAGVWLARRFPWGLRLGVQRVLAAILAGGALALVFIHDSGYPQARATEVLVGVAVLVLAAPGLWRLFAAGRVAVGES